MAMAQVMTPAQWVSIGIIAAVTLIVWVVVIFILLPRLEVRLERKKTKKKIKESQKRVRRIRVDSESARLDLERIIPKE